jgi:hypothetical protein
MFKALLCARQAARRLGITVKTLYDWLDQSDHGLLIIRGQGVTIRYFQGGPKGRGRIKLEADEVARIRDLMQVRSQPVFARRPSIRMDSFPGITVELGRPDR